MTQLKRSGIALAILVASLAQSRAALAQAVQNCEDLPAPIIYGIGGSAQVPLIGLVASKLAAAADPITIVYASPGACFAMDALNPANAPYKYAQPDPTKVQVNYWLPGNAKAQVCTISTAGGITPDFGSMQNGPTLCSQVPQAGLWDTVGDFADGAVGTTNFIVPPQSDEHSISADAAYFVFGAGADSKVKPWTVNNTIIRRNESSAVQLYVALAAGLAPTVFKGIDALNNTNSIKYVTEGRSNTIDTPNYKASIGFVSGEVADANRAKVRTLAYQHSDQTCGYYPDSSANSFDKINVRTGQYYLWGTLHFYAPINKTTKKIVDPTVNKFIGYMNGDIKPPADVPILDAIIDNHNVPQCAMQVKRTTDLGPLESYQPDEPCGCYFENRATGVTNCDSCPNGDGDCTKGDAHHCRLGFCEVK